MYDLSEIGRIKINKKLYRPILQNKSRTLQPEDLLGLTNYILKTNKN